MACADTNCAECAADAAFCTYCISPYIAVNGYCMNSACQAENCISCPESDLCTACLNGFMRTGWTCAQRCGNTLCTVNEICKDGQSCENCENGNRNFAGICACTSMVTCLAGTYCSTDKCKYCIASLPNCKICSSATSCQQMQEECIIAHCIDCGISVSTCSVCSNGYELKSGLCVQLGCSISYCLTCSDTSLTKCSECQHNYEISSQGQCKLRTCTDINCNVCADDYQICTQCKAGLTNIFGKCVNTGCNDKNCVGCSSITKCTFCQSDYTENNGICYQKCGDEVCTTNEICRDRKCSKCRQNEYNQSGVCVCFGQITCDSNDKNFYCNDNQECTSCSIPMANCKQCESSDVCENSFNSCFDMRCKLCPINTIQCQQCSDGYSLQQSSQQCVENGCLVENCITCYQDSGWNLQPNKCQQCFKFYQVTNDFQCKRNCSAYNCKKCENINICTECKEGYILNSDNLCEEHCNTQLCNPIATCVDGKQCKNCTENQLNNIGYCTCKYTDSNCTSFEYCTEVGCILCQTPMKNCRKCSSSTICTEVIYECTTLNCTMCENNQAICTKCAHGYQLTIEKTCKADISCQSTISNCTLCNSVTTCYKCAENFKLSNIDQKCYQLCANNTDLCNDSQICFNGQYCKSCNESMHNFAGNCVCGTGNITCPEEQFCSSENMLNTDNICKKCSLAMPNCSQCISSTICTKVFSECAVNQCTMCPMNVATCTACKQGYFLSQTEGSTAICMKCIASCENCSNVNLCAECKNGYRLENSQCVKKSAGTGLIIGIVLGIAVLIALGGGITVILVKKKRLVGKATKHSTTTLEVVEFIQEQQIAL